VCYLVGASAGVVQEQKHCIIPAALGSAAVGRLQQRIQFVLFQVGDQLARGFLERDGLNLPAPMEVFWAVQTYEACQGTNGGKTLISRIDSTAARFFHILKESSRAVRREILHLEPIDPSAGTASDERQELLQGVTIAFLRIPGEVSLDNEVLQQEPADPRAQ
jgi:hypothetical protein